MKKRLLSLVLTLAMVLSFFPGMTITANALSKDYPASNIRDRLTLAKGVSEDEYVVQGLLELQFECAYGKTFASEGEAQAARDQFCAVNNGQETQLFENWAGWAKFNNNNDADLVVTANPGDSHLVFCCWYGTGNTTSSHCYAIIPLEDAAEERVAMLKVGATVVPNNYWMDQQGNVHHGAPDGGVENYAYYIDSVLTLKNFTFNKDFFSFSKYWRDENEYSPKIQLIGQNTLSQSISTGHNLLITGEAGASLTLNGGNIGFEDVTLTISNTTLNITNDGYGIDASPGQVVIDGSNVTISSKYNAVRVGYYDGYGTFTVTGNSNVDLKSGGPALNIGKNNDKVENIVIDPALSAIASTEKEGGTFVDYDKAENNSYKHIKIGKFIKDLGSNVTFDKNEDGSGKVTITMPAGATEYAYKVITADQISTLMELVGGVVGSATLATHLSDATPETAVKEIPLTPGQSVTFAIATDDGEGKITGIYAGTYTATKPINDGDVTIDPATFVYNGEEQKPAVTVRVDGNVLSENTDYTLTYIDDTINVGDKWVQIDGMNYYSGTVRKNYTITPKPLEAGQITATVGHVVKNINETGEIEDKDAADCSVYYDGDALSYYAPVITIVGDKATVTFELKGNYTGTKTVTDVPVKTLLEEWMLDLSKLGETYNYNGSPIEPAVTGKAGQESVLGKDKLIEDTDFTVTYDGEHIDPGYVYVTIEGKGDYTGTVSGYYYRIDGALATIKPKDVTVTVGAALPTFELELLGVVEGDDITLMGDGNTPEFTILDENGDSIKDAENNVISGQDAIWDAIKSKVGTYTIRCMNPDQFPLWGENRLNYGTEYADGVLTITAKPSTRPSTRPSTGGSTITVPVSNDKNEVKVEASVSGNDATIKPMDKEQIEQIVGDNKAAGDVVVDLTELGKEVDTAGIPKASLEAIVEAAEDAKNDTAHLVIKLTTAELKLDDAAMRAIVDQANGDIVKFNFDDVGLTRMNSKQKDAVKDMDIRKGYEAYITVNGQRIGDFKGGKVEITVPYEIPAGENKAGFSVWYIDENGKPEKQKSTYDGKEKCFVVTHFSDYVIVYNEDDAQAGSYMICTKDAACPIHGYADANASAWYHDGVHYCIEHGIMNGVSTTRFAPNGAVTRQQVWMVLARLSGETPANMAAARTWAMANGVSDGTNPTNAVTRQQFITMLYRYAVDKGYDVSVGEETNILSYADAFSVSEYAIPAMQWGCGSGIMGGYSDGTLKPTSGATRAHLAAFLQRFCVNA